MLKFFKRSTQPALVTDGHDPLEIRNLLDYPQLQAVMGPVMGSVMGPGVDQLVEPTQLRPHTQAPRERMLQGAA